MVVARSTRTHQLLFPWNTDRVRSLRRMAQTIMMNSATGLPHVPQMFRERPSLEDSLETETSAAQNDTLEVVLPHILGLDGGPFELNSHGIPKLRRQQHIAFLRKTLEKMPSAYTALDAARPWVIYWTLAALSLLREDVTEFREQVISTLAAAQSPSGGFGGGHGQLAHVATSFAAVLSLAMVGGSAAFEMIDRRAMWEWLGRIKDSTGGFRMAVGAERDARGAYCPMVILVLLNLPIELPPDAPARQAGMTTFLDNLPEWVAQCQSYEGGISAGPNSEAHGAYTFCGLACLSIVGEPKDTFHRYLDLAPLVGWLSDRQNAPEGGLSGRTNKLVDSCYGHWVGGCWNLVHEGLRNDNIPQPPMDIWNREGIIRYIICAAQSETGGMRDKPEKRPDAYHSCYALAGLSAMQYRHTFQSSSTERGPALNSAFQWALDKSDDPFRDNFFDKDDLLEPLHPIFAIPYPSVEAFRNRALEKQGF